MSTFSEPMFESSALLANMRDLDMSNLITEKNALEAELAQCKADKDFVWSLWKRLQVSNPDVTEAISLVIQREKDKSETKDRKVLEIIQVKDDRIEELQNIVTRQSHEISEILAKKAEVTEKSSRFQLDKDRLQGRVTSLEAQLRSEENREKNLEDTFRKTVEGSEKEKYDLSRQVSRLMTELEVAKSEKDHAQSRQKLLEERTRCLEKEVSQKMVKFEELVREVEDSTGRLTRYETQTAQQRRDLEFKNQELENVRKELKELWMAHNQLTEHSGQQADLIRQLQNLQQDTQKMMKNQEDAFTLESTSLQQMFTDVNTRYETSKRTEADLRQQVLELKKSLMDKDDVISSLRTQTDIPLESVSSARRAETTAPPDYSGSFLDIVTEVDSMDAPEARARKPRGRSLGRLSANRELDKVDQTRSRSLSPLRSTRSALEGNNDLRDLRLEQKLEEMEKALQFKTRQVKELRQAHDNRLERLRSLQSSYKLARDEIKLLDGGKKENKLKNKKPKRANPRSLQKENSDQVWNELSFFKAENRSLQVDKLGLQEEVDLLRVQTSQDAATIYELQVSSQSLHDEYEFQLRKVKRDLKENRGTEHQLSTLKSQVQNKTVHIEKLERDITNAVSQRDDLVQEKSKLMSQLVSAQQEASQHRMELADLKHELQSLRFELEEQKFKSEEPSKEDDQTARDPEVITAVASRLLAKQKKLKKNKNDSLTKKYQKALNRSIEKMSDAFEDFNDDGWEEVPGSDSDPDSEVSSLGDSITKLSQQEKAKTQETPLRKKKTRRVPTHRPPSARSCNKFTTTSTTTSPHHVSLRDNATSPISFLAPTISQTEQIQPSLTAAVSKAPTTNATRRRALENRQISALKNRIHHLQQQVTVLKRSKFLALKSEEELTETVSKLQSELSSTSSRLKTAKQQVSKYQGELEKLQKDKDNMAFEGDKADDKKMGEGQEVKVLEARLKVASSEASRHAATMRNLKTENDGLHEQVRNLQDRINHLERDVTQKRSLLESQRMKLKHVQDMSKSEANNLEELQTKLKLLTDNNNKLKVQIDSLKKRIGVVSKDKKDYEEKFLKVSLELEHKTKLLHDATTRRSALESALSELESSAQHQLHGLASQSEAAIDAAKVRLTKAQTKISHFHSLIKVLGAELIKRTERARNKMQEAKASQERSQREEDLSLRRAQDKARDILNLSHSDLEDIMSADGESVSMDSVSGDNKKADRRWLRKCEKLTGSEENFVHPLTSLLLQKVDERADLLLKIPKLK